MHLISEVQYGAYLAYSPYGTTELAKQSRGIRDALKHDYKGGNPPIQFSEHIIKELVRERKELPFQDFFDENVLLIPIPGSGKTNLESLWPARRLVQEMEKKGLGIASTCLRRETGIRKSAYCKAENRPIPKEHFETFSVQPSVHRPSRIVLVDDIITRGSTILGAVSKIQEAFPEVEFFAFAIMRTITGTNDFIHYDEPVIGRIILRQDGQTWRDP